MGLSIHYNGRFNRKASLKKMIEEVRDIVEVYQWKYYVFEDIFPDNGFGKTQCDRKIYGICFTPPECETVWLTFLSNGRMSTPVHLRFYGNTNNKRERRYLYMISVKTQYAGIEIHKLVIHLLKYIREKYLQDFNVSDEGEYWETGDEQLLANSFERYTFLINTVSSLLQSESILPGESLETYFERLMKRMHEKFKP